MRKKKSIVTTIYVDDGKIVNTVIQYNYDSEDEKEEHKKLMIKKGFEDSGQVKEMIGSLWNPEHIWFGSYSKTDRIE